MDTKGADRGLIGRSQAQQLIETAASGNALALVSLLSGAPQPWPVAPATLLFVAVQARQPGVVSLMLSMGAPAHLACGQLAPGDRAALAAAGMSVDGASHLCPLTVAVRQQHLDMCRLLLDYGAPANRSADGLPVLLHFLDAVASAGGNPAASAGPDSTTSGGGTSSRGTPSRAATPSSSIPSHGQLSRPSRGPDDLAAYLQSIENQLQMLHLLLTAGSCPLERPRHLPTDSRCFLSACQQPALLRMAVNHVLAQCHKGRHLSDEDAKQLVDAAGRAVLGGF